MKASNSRLLRGAPAAAALGFHELVAHLGEGRGDPKHVVDLQGARWIRPPVLLVFDESVEQPVAPGRPGGSRAWVPRACSASRRRPRRSKACRRPSGGPLDKTARAPRIR